MGEMRGYCSLGSLCTSAGDYKRARHFNGKYMELAVEVGDSEGVDAARENLTQLDNVLQLQDK